MLHQCCEHNIDIVLFGHPLTSQGFVTWRSHLPKEETPICKRYWVWSTSLTKLEGPMNTQREQYWYCAHDTGLIRLKELRVPCGQQVVTWIARWPTRYSNFSGLWAENYCYPHWMSTNPSKLSPKDVSPQVRIQYFLHIGVFSTTMLPFVLCTILLLSFLGIRFGHCVSPHVWTQQLLSIQVFCTTVVPFDGRL